MRVDLTVVAVLDTEADVHSAALEHVIGKADVPSRDLKDVQQVVWHVFVCNVSVHDVTERPHF